MSTPLTDIDDRALRDVFGRFPSGVVSVCAVVDEKLTGIAMSTFVPVSLRPPLVAVCVSHSSQTWPTLRTAPSLGVSVLGENQAGVARALASRTGDRFAGLPITTAVNGAVFIGGSSTWLDTTVDDEVPAGDHVIVTLRVNSVTLHESDRPLVFHHSGFHNLA